MRGKSGELSKLVDPRSRFVGKVHVAHPDGRPETVVGDYGGGSGGGKERMKAFITAAAMAYALDTPNDNRPQFAPMLFDEAMVKSDHEITRIVIGALKGLGFQVVVSCPDSKMSTAYPLAERAAFTSRQRQDGPVLINQDVREGLAPC